MTAAMVDVERAETHHTLWYIRPVVETKPRRYCNTQFTVRPYFLSAKVDCGENEKCSTQRRRGEVSPPTEVKLRIHSGDIFLLDYITGMGGPPYDTTETVVRHLGSVARHCRRTTPGGVVRHYRRHDTSTGVVRHHCRHDTSRCRTTPPSYDTSRCRTADHPFSCDARHSPLFP